MLRVEPDAPSVSELNVSELYVSELYVSKLNASKLSISELSVSEVPRMLKRDLGCERSVFPSITTSTGP